MPTNIYGDSASCNSESDLRSPGLARTVVWGMLHSKVGVNCSAEICFHNRTTVL